MLKLLPKSWLRIILMVMVMGLVGAGAWWSRLKAGALGQDAGVEMNPLLPTLDAHGPPSAAGPAPRSDSPVEAVRRQRVAATKHLAAAQQAALEGVAEADLPAAMARFAADQRGALDKLASMEKRLTNPDFNPGVVDPLPEAVARKLASPPCAI